MDIIENLNWRYAVKKFDASKKIPEQQFATILESLRLSASSFGLQPWSFVVVDDASLRNELIEHSWNQKQVADASHLIVLCRQLVVDDAYVDRYIEDICQTRGVDKASLEGYAGMMKGFLSKMDESSLKIWTEKQVYLALGSLLTACAVLKIDSCPMEGFIPTVYDEKLGLSQKGLASVVVCPVGYRDEDDDYIQRKKVRFGLENIVLRIPE